MPANPVMTSVGSPSTLPPTAAANSPNVYPVPVPMVDGTPCPPQEVRRDAKRSPPLQRPAMEDLPQPRRLPFRRIEALDDLLGEVDGIGSEEEKAFIALEDDGEAFLSAHGADD